MNQQLFVYGSLRSGFRNPAYEYLTKYFRLLGEAVVKGKFYDKGEYPVATPAQEGDNYIHGELYEIKNNDEFVWAIEQLDDYEGLNVEVGETPLYKREAVEVFLAGKTSKAWIYWYNRDISGLAEIPSGDVMQYLLQKNKPS
ncbi:MAG: gamma-glutamylcyclotransferase family protein [Ferruginibacter sp.]